MKTNTTTLLAFIALLSLLAVSCNMNNEHLLLKENLVEFDTLVVEKKSFLRNDTTNPFCDLNLHFVYPSQTSKYDLKRLQQLFIRNTLGQNYDDFVPKEAIEKYEKAFLRNYEADAHIFEDDLQTLKSHSTLSSQNMDMLHEEQLQDNEFYSYQEILKSKICFNKNNILSFQVSRFNNKGGTATYSSFNNYVINLLTGNLITENDIFIAGYDMALQQLFANSLIEQNGVKTISDLEDLGYFGIEEIMPNRNFLIDEDGITYIFNKGEYSAYLLDAPKVFIPYEEVKMLLKENTLVSKLAEQ